MGTKPTVYFRADGNPQIGLGHVIRSLALAEILKDDFDCHFIIRKPLPTLKEKISATCSVIIELDDNNDSSQEATKISLIINAGEIIVLDGYHFNTAYQKVFKDNSIKVVCIDDIHAYHFVADVVINHAPSVNQNSYSMEDNTVLCTGLDYALLRKPFLSVAKIRKSIPTVNAVLICLGGADPENITLKILKAIINRSSTIEEVHVVIGEANCHGEIITSFSKSIRNLKVCIYNNLNAEEMSKLMHECHLAIVPASTISFEAFACQMKVACGYFADNQKEYYEFLEKNNFATTIGNYLTVSEKELADKILSAVSRTKKLYQPIDDLVTERLLSIFKNLHVNYAAAKFKTFQKEKLLFKDYTTLNEEDLMQVLDFRNDPSVRKWMFDKNEITKQSHFEFVTSLITELNKRYLAVYKNGQLIGAAYINSIDIRNASCEWGFFLNPKMIGSGIGLEVEYHFLNFIFQNLNMVKVFGWVNKSNIDSIPIQNLFGFEQTHDAENFMKVVLDIRVWQLLPSDFKTFRKTLLKSKARMRGIKIT
jgi:UDP-2,4-diacetamido-2,4,6-trideoxy-beta-L-altropyranose hydrolase/UDP-4-amino-4,6-dideoxy-N-acetyl-beta-L-altrosamine N-acetyltransferase